VPAVSDMCKARCSSEFSSRFVRLTQKRTQIQTISYFPCSPNIYTRIVWSGLHIAQYSNVGTHIAGGMALQQKLGKY